MSTFDSKQTSDFKGVWVVCELEDPGISHASLEILSAGRKLADDLHTELCALLIGGNVSALAKRLGGYGADRVQILEHPLLETYTTEGYTSAVCQAVQAGKPNILLFSATTTGRDLAPRCAARLKTGLCADCTDLHILKEDYLTFISENSSMPAEMIAPHINNTDLKMTMPAFGGHLMATIVCPRFRPQMATIRPGVMQVEEFNVQNEVSCVIEHLEVALREEEIRTRTLRRVQRKNSSVCLEDAEVIVAVGNGIGSDVEKGLELAAQLADAMGGVVGATRDAVNAGWVTEDRMIGQTGKIVRPRIYIALGVSGAIQHQCGMKDAACIIAVNSDKNAPIFEITDYGIVGDLFDVVPSMIEEICRRTDCSAVQID